MDRSWLKGAGGLWVMVQTGTLVLYIYGEVFCLPDGVDPVSGATVGGLSSNPHFISKS